MRHLSAAEAHRNLNTIAVLEELLSVAELRVEIVGVYTGRHTNFLDFDDTLIFLGFLFLLGLLEAELAVVHYLTDGRSRVGGNFDEVELLFIGYLESCLRGHNAELLTLAADQANFFIKDIVVDLMSDVCDCDSPPRKIKSADAQHPHIKTT